MLGGTLLGGGVSVRFGHPDPRSIRRGAAPRRIRLAGLFAGAIGRAHLGRRAQHRLERAASPPRSRPSGRRCKRSRRTPATPACGPRRWRRRSKWRAPSTRRRRRSPRRRTRPRYAGLRRRCRRSNTLATQMASLNQQIRTASAGGQCSPDALLDARQNVQDQLVTLTGATPITDAQGDVSLALPSGDALVSGDTAAAPERGTRPDQWRPPHALDHPPRRHRPERAARRLDRRHHRRLRLQRPRRHARSRGEPRLTDQLASRLCRRGQRGQLLELRARQLDRHQPVYDQRSRRRFGRQHRGQQQRSSPTRPCSRPRAARPPAMAMRAACRTSSTCRIRTSAPARPPRARWRTSPRSSAPRRSKRPTMRRRPRHDAQPVDDAALLGVGRVERRRAGQHAESAERLRGDLQGHHHHPDDARRADGRCQTSLSRGNHAESQTR